MAKKKSDFGGLLPFGFQKPSGGDGFGSLFYSMGMPGKYSGRITSVYQDQFNNALLNGRDPNEIMPWGSGSKNAAAKMAPPVEEKPQIQWAFPQYSQTWAFTPPVAPPYIMPPPFNKKTYK
jgi:hypothetical protein